MSVQTILAENVRRLRKAQGLSMRQLAKNANISPTNIVRIEAGDANPQLELIEKIARSLNTTEGHLLSKHDGLDLHPLALRVAVDVDQAFRDAAVSCEPSVLEP